MPSGDIEENDVDKSRDDWREPPGWLGEYVRRVKRLMAQQSPPREQASG